YDANGDPVIGEGLTSDEGCAFEIKYPAQLYYFAWLQALGYFNQPNEDQSAINQYYFYISDDLDMTGWVLPQIGTQEYPFVGNLNGNGHIISNLTVQNAETVNGQVWSDKPDETISGLNIVGFFGVIGELGNTGSVNGYTFSSQVNEVKNFALEDVNIKTAASNSLAGIVAGYVNGNISNIQVRGNSGITNVSATAPLSTYTSNLSDYTLIGYATEDYRDTRDVVLISVDTPTEDTRRFNYMSQGASAGWGGSIDMLDMYTRLANVHGTNFGNMTNITSSNHIATKTIRYAADGTMIGTPVESNGAPSDNFYYQYTAANDGSGKYVLSAQNGVGTTQFYYLASTYKTVVEIHETNDTANAFYIQQGGTYLNLNNAGNGVTNTTPTAGNTKWVIDANNYIYTQDSDGNKYYLYDNDNTLGIGEQPYYYISCTTNNTTYYLNENNGAIQRGTTATTKWYLSGSGTGTLYTESTNGNTYYLYTNGSNGNLSLQTNNSTVWTINNNGRISYVSGNNTYYILHYNNAWTCRTTGYYNNVYGTMAQEGSTPQKWNKSADAIRNSSGEYVQYNGGWKTIADAAAVTGYTISYSGNYLNITGTGNNVSIGTATTSSSYSDNGHTVWIFSNPGSNPSGKISTVVGGNTYYLRDANGNNGTLRLTTNSDDTYTTWTNSSGRLYAYSNSRYIRWNTNAWRARDNTNNNNVLTFTQAVAIPAVTHTALTFTNTTIPVVNRIETSEPAEFGYIPLGASQTSPYSVSQSNTGYIVGGSHETTSDRKSDIRVSQYSKSNITSGLTSTNANGQVSDGNVRTVDGSGIHTINTANLARYSAAVKQFNTVLNGTTNVYGLHFMNAEISKDNLIVAPTVMLEGTTYTNYQMPEDSIDFIAHQKGYITFFAGTYFTNNDSFFSLHTIERYKEDDAEVLAGTAQVNDIKSIKEIKEIWKSSDQSKDYIYYLKDGNNYEWSATKTSDYTLAFNTDWITQPGTTNQLGTTNLYYFEIPVNSGEFALGSVEGRVGAYLIYLDIAANAQLVDRLAVVENFEEITKTYEFPVGATFRDTLIDTSSSTPVIPSAIASVPVSSSAVNVTVTDDTHLTFSTGTLNYIDDGVTVNSTLTQMNIPGAPKSTTTKKIRRTTYYDYNVAKNMYTVTVVTVTQVDGGAKSMIINAWNTGSDWDITSNDATQIAEMTAGFTPNTGAATNNVAINTGASQILDYVAVDDIYCYLINVSSAADAQTLR
ncbi:MAG: hypothetical protein J6T73_06305, partial [Clostridia bacterium]|nr:hypothetical protein [Clostridia bacterium]